MIPYAFFLFSAIESDGNCFFRACARVISGYQSEHDIVRDKLEEYIKTNHDEIQQYIEIDDKTEAEAYLRAAILDKDRLNLGEKYLLQLELGAQPKWATEVHMFALAKLIERDVVTWHSNMKTGGDWMRHMAGDEPSEESLYLINVGGVHFEVIYGVEKLPAHED